MWATKNTPDRAVSAKVADSIAFERAATRADLQRVVCLAVIVFSVIRVATLVAIAIAAHAEHRDLLAVLTKADGLWYLRIAKHGYGPTPPIGPDGTYTHLTTLAFFPLYPALIRSVALLGIPYGYAALGVAAACALAAAAFIAAWARTLIGGRGAIVLVTIWGLLPTSAVFNMAYSEGLFVAAAAATLLALQRNRFVAAAFACSVAGLTRPTGAGLVIAVFIALAVAAWRRRAPITHILVAALVAPLGLLAALAHVAVVTGRVDGWLWLEHEPWNSGFDGGASFVRIVAHLSGPGEGSIPWPVLMSAVVVVAFVAAYIVWLRRPLRREPADVAYVTVAGLMALGERNYAWVKPRFLLVAFPVLVPIARWLARRKTATLVAVGIPVFATSLAWNAYLVAVWRASV